MNEHELHNKLQSAAADIGNIPSIKDSVMSQVAAQAPHPHASSRWSNRFAYARWAVAAGILVVVGLLFYWDRGPASTGLAWADVQKQMTAANTLVCLVSESSDGAAAHVKKSYIKSPRLVRVESPGGQATPYSSAASAPSLPPAIDLLSSEGEDRSFIQLFPIAPRAYQGSRRLDIGVATDNMNFPLAFLHALQQIQATQVANMGEQDLDGVRTVRFDTLLPDSLIEVMGLPKPVNGKISLWVDQASALPRRVEMKGHLTVPSRNAASEFAILIDQMEWNKPLDDGLFEPPSDYELKILDYWTIAYRREVGPADFRMTIKLEDGTILATDKDGKAAQSRGGFEFRLDQEHVKAVEEVTARHIGEVLNVSIGDYNVQRKVKYPVAGLTIACYPLGNPPGATGQSRKWETPSQVTNVAPSKLDLRIAPYDPGSSKGERLSASTLETYEDWLQQGKIGAWWTKAGTSLEPTPEYTWLPVLMDSRRVSPDLIVRKRQGRVFLLVSNRPQETMRAGQTGQDAWGLQRTYVTADAFAHPAVGMDLDESGSRQLAGLSKNNLHHALAIIVDGQVVSVPIIQAQISSAAMIQGEFTNEQAQRMAAALEAGMPPTAGVATQPASH